MSILQTLLKATVLTVGARVLGGVIGFVVQVLIARLLGAEPLGLYYLSFSLMTVLAIVCSLGYPSILTRFVVGVETEGDAGNGSKFLAHMRREILIAGFLVTAVGLAVISFLPDLSFEKRLSLGIAIAAAPLFTLTNVLGSLSNAYKKFLLAYSPNLFFRPLLIMLTLGFLWLFSPAYGVVYLVLAHVLISIGFLFYQNWQLHDVFKQIAGNNGGEWYTTAGRTDEATRRKWRFHATPMIFATLFLFAFTDLDLVVLGFIATERDLAIFGVSMKVALFLTYPIQAIHQIILRDLAEAIKSGEGSKINAIVSQANFISIVLSFGLLLFVALFGGMLLRVFGPTFDQGHIALMIIMAAQLIRAIAGPATEVLTLKGFERNSLPVFGFSLLLIVALNFFLVPDLHLIGAALAVLIVMIVWSLGLSFIAYKKTGIVTAAIHPRSVLKFLS
jgi:O-antigen/teichoic acid export membrane protein